MLDGESPGREGVVEEETIGDVLAADLGEDQHQVFGADKAGTPEHDKNRRRRPRGKNFKVLAHLAALIA